MYTHGDVRKLNYTKLQKDVNRNVKRTRKPDIASIITYIKHRERQFLMSPVSNIIRPYFRLPPDHDLWNDLIIAVICMVVLALMALRGRWRLCARVAGCSWPVQSARTIIHSATLPTCVCYNRSTAKEFMRWARSCVNGVTNSYIDGIVTHAKHMRVWYTITS
jgi:hypothetical protein